MTDYTTCRRCHTLLQVTGGENVHPLCEPLPTRLEVKRDNLAGLQALLEVFPVVNPEEVAFEIEDLEREITELESRPPNLLAAAVKMAVDWGWPVFPLKAGTKVPDCPHGFKDATTDQERITRWWIKHPLSNIGIPTGLPETFDVFDVDRPKREGQVDGELAYGELLAAGELPDTHAHVRTANDGLHLYVEPDPTSNSHTNIVASVDYRGAGGYVVVPPSVLEGAGRWRWLIAPSPVIRK